MLLLLLLLGVVIVVAVAVHVAVQDPSGCLLASREPRNLATYDKTASTSQIRRKLRYEIPSAGGPEAEEANLMKFHIILIDVVDVVRSKMISFGTKLFV